MYLPERFTIKDRGALHGVMGAHPFATLCTLGPDGVEADHLPLLLVPGAGEPDRLLGHVARANPLWRSGEGEALAIFHGPHAYVTPSWYPDKARHGRVVPTWNYVVVHARGRLRFFDDPARLVGVVTALSERFEKDRASPWSVDDAPADYIDGMCRAIVGVELTVTRLVGKHKGSQHKSEEEREAIRRGLHEEYGLGVAEAACLGGTPI